MTTPNFVQIATILNSTKSVILTTLLYGNICVHTKFDENTFIDDPDKVKKHKSKMAAAAILNFAKSVILGTGDGHVTNMPIVMLNFQRVLFRPRKPLCGQYVSADKIWCKLVNN